MKYSATEKFAELDSLNNYQGLGKDIFHKIESGSSVDCNPPDWLVKEGYIKQSSQTKSKKEID